MSTSAIVYTTINENFPAAGQDNDSQGFRDNFARIKTGLGTAQSEITYLNNNAVDRTKNNDMGNNTLSNVVLKNSGITSDSTLVSAPVTAQISYSDSQYRRYSLGNSDNTFQIDNWPISCYAEIYLEMVVSEKVNVSNPTAHALFQVGVINNELGAQSRIMHLGTGFGTNTYLSLERYDTSNNIKTYLVKVASPDGGVNTFVSLVDTFIQQP